MSFLGKFAVAPPSVCASWYAIPLRLIVGLGFLEHGYAKLSRGAGGFIGILHAIGVPFPHLLGWATIIVEIVGGLLILAGAFIPVATVPMVVVLLVAIFTVHLPNGFSSIKLVSYDASGAHFGQPGYETDLLYIAGSPHPLFRGCRADLARRLFEAALDRLSGGLWRPVAGQKVRPRARVPLLMTMLQRGLCNCV
jgi:putative oxidoreductase